MFEPQSELKAFTFNKRNSGFVEHQSEVYPKRQKQSSIECHFCGKLGHKMFECKFKKQQHHLANDKERHVRHDEHRREKSNVTCYKCGDWGHITTQCTKISGQDWTSNLIGILFINFWG